MEKELAKTLVNVLRGDAEVYEDYSGRGMYGKTTTGIVFNGSMAGLILALINGASEIAESIDFKVPAIKMDSMGRGTIIY